LAVDDVYFLLVSNRQLRTRFNSSREALVRLILLPRSVVVVVAVCSGACSPNTGAGNVPVSTVTVSPGAVTINVASSTQLTAQVNDDQGNRVICAALHWASTAPGVATVSTAGLVTGAAVGSAFVRATCQDKSDSAQVIVTPAGGVSQ
jgi:uncharacterized protein YjdB